MFPEWTWIVGLYIGAAVGSFLNVVIYRMPRSISLYNPAHSFCPKCKHPLGIADLMPLFSWLFSRGRCRYCGEKIAPRYFAVELFNGVIWAGIWYQYLIAGSDPGKAIAYSLAAATLVAIIFIDWEFYIIPEQVNAFLFFVGIGYNIWLYAANDPRAETWGIPSSVAGALMGIGVLWGIAFLGRILFRKDAMGHGDIKMARGIGAVLFPIASLMSFGLAVVLGAVIGIIQVAARSRQGGDEEEGELPPAETIGSLLKSLVGYVLLIDIIGLFFPKLFIWWFGEDPFAELDDSEMGPMTLTEIPFGPYLALGAIFAVVFEEQLLRSIGAYWNWATGGPESLEQIGQISSPMLGAFIRW